MGCVRPKLFDDAEHAIDTDPSQIWQVPAAGVSEGQMDFRNTGHTTIAIKLGCGPASLYREVCQITGPYTILLLAGDAFTEDGLIPGGIVAVSSAAGGRLSTKVSYR